MPSALTGFCVGVIIVAWMPLSLKNVSFAAISLGFVCLLPIVLKVQGNSSNFHHLLCGLLIGVVYASGVGYSNLQHRLKDCGTGELIRITIGVTSSPVVQLDRQSFDAIILSTRTSNSEKMKIKGKGIKNSCESTLLSRKLRLSWYQGPKLRRHQRWDVEVKLRAPRGFQNFGGFDYEAWMFYSRLDASGTVKSGVPVETESVVPISAVSDIADRARQFFLQSDLAHKGVMLALVTGDNQAIGQSLWGMLRASGTIHLVVISGLHVGLIAALGFVLGQVSVRLFPPALLRTRARLPGVLGGLICSYLYCDLSGWNLPAQRAFTTLAIVAFYYFLNRRMQSRFCLLCVVTIQLILDPLSPLSSGFWLSFGAVAVLLLYFVPHAASGGAANEQGIQLNSGVFIVSRVKRFTIGLLRMQGVLFVGMIPIMWIWVGQMSLIAPLANMVAVPVISWVVVPVSMISFVLSGVWATVAYQLQTFTNNVLESLFAILALLDQFATEINLGYSQAGVMYSAGAIVWVLTAFSAVLFILPLNMKTRLAVGIGLFIPFVGSTSQPEEGEFRLTVLDVGQGSAYLVETSQHRLLYDTAALTRTGFNLGEAIVVPALLRTGSNKLDIVVLSHADMDHVGGYSIISQRFDIDMTYHGSPMPGIQGERCVAGQFWEWDGVRFQFLHPSSTTEFARNDQSCVLMISNLKHRVLLSGDISKKVELQIRHQVQPLSVLVVAHHGSQTSSALEFIKRAQPEISIISAGYANQFGHPHKDVLARLNRYSQKVLVTGDVGAVMWKSERASQAVSARLIPAPYWRVSVLSVDQ